MKKYAFLFLILVTAGCKNEPPVEPPKPATLTLKAEDASCTEAWVKATTTETPATVALLRDNQRVAVLRLLTSDSLLFDEGLLPKHTYTYQLQKLGSDSSVVETSTSAQLTTMDTTSHNFTWQIDTLGATSSVLYDVAIINDTLAYAVGEMYLRDSMGQIDPQAYNMAKWNGAGWQLMRIQFYTICGQASRTPYPASAVFAFSATDIWIAMRGDQVARWNGSGQTATMCLPVSFTINKLWGESPNSVYAVGNGGNIMYYNGSTWQRMESGTSLPIQDVWGDANLFNRSTEVIAVASYFPINQGVKLLSINPSGVREVPSKDIPWRMSGVWFLSGKGYFVVGDGLMVKRTVEDTTHWMNLAPGLTQYYMRSITGNAINNIVVSGDFGNMLHFNGVIWKSLRDQTAMSGIFLDVAARDRFILAVGLNQGRAIVLRGYQQ